MKLLKIAVSLAVAGGIAVTALLWLTQPQTLEPAMLPSRTADLANGKTLFFAGGCLSCHGNEKDKTDRQSLPGGHALQTPFGTFVAPNISMHKTDGIGAWNEAEFASAMLKGTSPRGKHYYPAFPYVSYANMTLNDVRDLWAYMQTLPAIEGKAPAHELSFPFNIRLSLGMWKALHMPQKSIEKTATSTQSQNQNIERGRYLVEGPLHCAECHSPRNLLGGIIEKKRYAGGPAPDGKGKVPNILYTEQGIGKWSKSEIISLLSDGFTPEFDVVGGTMAAVVRNTSQLSAQDKDAIAEYMMTLK